MYAHFAKLCSRGCLERSGGNARATEEANRQGATPIATINGTRLAEIARDRDAAECWGEKEKVVCHFG